MTSYQPQVDHSDYHKPSYNHPKRWTTHALVIRQVIELQPKTILEIGPGSGVVTQTLKQLGFDVTTMDIDPDLSPDIVCDVSSKEVATLNTQFDLVIACEVLEHIEYEDATRALTNLRNITNQLLLTLPHTNKGAFYTRLAFKLPLLKPMDCGKKWFLRRQTHTFNGQHYWEIGKRDHSLRRTKKDIQSAGWNVLKDHVNPDYTYHHLFLLQSS